MRRYPTSGSSPLARGLLNNFKSKVITAQDHPRSRGVYVTYVTTDYRKGRIIPARAGFT